MLFRSKGAAEEKRKVPMSSYLSVPDTYSYNLAREAIDSEISEDPRVVMESMGWMSNPKFSKLPKSAFDYIKHEIDFTTDDVRYLAEIIDENKLNGIMDVREDNEASDYLANLVADKYNKLLRKWRRK